MGNPFFSHVLVIALPAFLPLAVFHSRFSVLSCSSQETPGFGRAVSSPHFLADFMPIKLVNVWNALEGSFVFNQNTTDTWKSDFAGLNVPDSCCTNSCPVGQDPIFIRTAEQQANFSPTEITVCTGLATSAREEAILLCRCEPWL